MVSAQIPDQRADLNDLLRVQADRRLIQDDELGFSEDCLRQSDTLSVSFGEVPDQALAHICDTRAVRHRIDLFFPLLCRNLLELCDELQIFLHRHIHVQRRDLGEIADAFLGLRRLL